MLICPTLAVSCASQAVTKTVIVSPPEILLREIPVPETVLKTNGDLLYHAMELTRIVEEHNADKRALQAFMESVQE